MDKAKTNITSMVPNEETKEYKKRRMQEVRTLVARAHKQGKRVDLMDFEGTDIPRAMIALQDLLAKSEERHRKATKHISFATNIGDVMSVVMNDAAQQLIDMQARNAELSNALHAERYDHMQTAMYLQQAHNDADDFQADLLTLKRANEIMNE